MLSPFAVHRRPVSCKRLRKMACAAGAPANVDRIFVAVAIWPRGEVTLVFVTLGAALDVGGHPLLYATQYSAWVAVVVPTTLAAPPALRWWWAHAASGRPRKIQWETN